MCPLMPPTVTLGPGDDDRDAAVLLLDPVDPQVVVPFPVAPLDR
jgi:hypothetical protein